jgi:hypothetical protein
MALFVPIWNTVVVMNAWKVIKVDVLIMNKLAHCVIMGENACSMYHSIHGLHTLSKTLFFGSWIQGSWKAPRIAKSS